MAVKTKKSVIYHIPKCGGIWVKETIRRAGIPYTRSKDRAVGHKELRNDFRLEREHSLPPNMWPEDVKGLFSFCFVRHPLGWYKSIWRFRKNYQVLNPKFPVDRNWVPVYEDFVNNMLNSYPNGFVTELFQYYVGENIDGVDFVGRQENLADDLVKALTLADETFDEKILRTTKRWNRSKEYTAVLSEETQNRVLEVEKWVIDSFYSGRQNAQMVSNP